MAVGQRLYYRTLLHRGFIIARKEQKPMNFHEQYKKHKVTPIKLGLQRNEGSLRRPGYCNKKHVC